MALETRRVMDYDGEFSFDNQSCHNDLILFHNNTAVRKKGTVQGPTHVSVFSKKKYFQEVVYWEFRIVCATRATLMIGASPDNTLLTPYPGHSPVNGLSYYLMDNKIHCSGAATPYSLALNPPIAHSGTYVGVLLDTVCHTIQFSVNGEFGDPIRIPGPPTAHYITVNIHDGQECIENY